MKRLLIAFAALSLTSCTAADVSHAVGIPTPVEYAARTAVDEQVGVGIENAYKGFRLALELGVDSGVITGARATAARAANNCAYRAVLVFRQAYKTANSADLLAAARSANIAIEQALASFKGENKCLTS
jgi:hypothetical protein